MEKRENQLREWTKVGIAIGKSKLIATRQDKQRKITEMEKAKSISVRLENKAHGCYEQIERMCENRDDVKQDKQRKTIRYMFRSINIRLTTKQNDSNYKNMILKKNRVGSYKRLYDKDMIQEYWLVNKVYEMIRNERKRKIKTYVKGKNQKLFRPKINWKPLRRIARDEKERKKIVEAADQVKK